MTFTNTKKFMSQDPKCRLREYADSTSRHNTDHQQSYSRDRNGVLGVNGLRRRLVDATINKKVGHNVNPIWCSG